MSVNFIYKASDQYNFEMLSDRKMKLFLEQFLTARGWSLEVPLNSRDRIDIEARRGEARWHVHVRGVNCRTIEPVGSFISILGDTLMRMDIAEDKYSIALPDTGPIYRLWKRLPSLAKKRTGLTALFVNPSGLVRESFEE